MKKLRAASILIAVSITAFTGPAGAASRACSICAGMELAQNAAPHGNSQDDNSGAPADEGSGNDDSQTPRGNDQGDGGSGDDGSKDDSDQASPPDAAQPPGCIFHNEPLQLLV